jgi:hypothetical protein
MKADVLEPQVAYTELVARLRCGPDPIAFVTAACAERVRAQLSMLAPGEKPAPLHTNSLMQPLRDALDGLQRWLTHVKLPGELTYDTLRSRVSADDVVEKLESIGDLIHLGQGWWLPAPSRLIVAEPLAGQPLLVSGLCSPLLEVETGAQAAHIGASRYLHCSNPYGTSLPSQDIEAWLGIRDEWSEGWARRLIRSSFTHGRRNDVELLPENLEAFQPSLAVRERKGHPRWLRVERLEGVPHHPVLCRRTLEIGGASVRQYCLALLEQSGQQVRARQVVDLQDSSAGRLILAYAAKAGVAREVAVSEERGYLRVHLPVRLPLPERRLLAFGWKVPEVGPWEWRFPCQVKPYLVYVFERLRCRVVQHPLGESHGS